MVQLGPMFKLSDAEITGQTVMLGRNRTPDAYVESGTIANGIGNLKFSYKQEFSNNVNLDVYVNGNLFITLLRVDSKVMYLLRQILQ